MFLSNVVGSIEMQWEVVEISGEQRCTQSDDENGILSSEDNHVKNEISSFILILSRNVQDLALSPRSVKENRTVP
jgi:hypothetical protein